MAENANSFDDLLEQMPRIAEAVKAFPEAVQPQAFEMLMAEARGEATATPAPPPAGGGRTSARRAKKARKPAASSDAKKPARRTAGKPTWLRGYDMTPKGGVSFKDFVAEKQPNTNHDRNVVAAYYLKEVRGEARVTLDHVYSCYKEQGWREPVHFANNLALTAHRKGYLDTSNMDDIDLTPRGRNRVEQELPEQKKTK